MLHPLRGISPRLTKDAKDHTKTNRRTRESNVVLREMVAFWGALKVLARHRRMHLSDGYFSMIYFPKLLFAVAGFAYLWLV